MRPSSRCRPPSPAPYMAAPRAMAKPAARRTPVRTAARTAAPARGARRPARRIRGAPRGLRRLIHTALRLFAELRDLGHRLVDAALDLLLAQRGVPGHFLRQGLAAL